MKKISSLSLIVLLAIPSLALASIDENLKYGSRGTEVVELQEFLISKGYLNSTATGNFFSLTRAAVIAYQKAEDITPAVGFVGLITRGRINAELAVDDTQEIAETGTTTPPKQNSTNDLLKQQNELLKQQLQAQQQIIQNTTRPPQSPPSPAPASKTPTTDIYFYIASGYKETSGVSEIEISVAEAPEKYPVSIKLYTFSDTNHSLSSRSGLLSAEYKQEQISEKTRVRTCRTNFVDEIERCKYVITYDYTPTYRNETRVPYFYTLTYNDKTTQVEEIGSHQVTFDYRNMTF